MNAEIIGIGSELLLGQIANTDAQFISQQLSGIGVSVYFHTAVGDNRLRILETLSIASTRSDIIITTGGLGPTMDDISKETVAEYLGMDLYLHEPSKNRLEEYFKKRNRNMCQNNYKQAMFPKDCIVLPNDNGTAPGMIVERDDKVYIVLPGPPSELQPMFVDYVLPYLKAKTSDKIISRVIRIFGIGESAVEEKLKDLLANQSNPTIAPLASQGEVTLRVTAKGPSKEACYNLIEPVEKEIITRLGDAVYGFDDDNLESVVVSLLKKGRFSLAVAESCTGGLIANRITNVSGSSEVFLEGLVTYSNEAKIKRLGVLEETINKYGAVSEETAREMAIGVSKELSSDFGLSVTGIAGPTGGSEEKPVGLVFIGLSYRGRALVERYISSGNRLRVKNQSASLALNLLRLYLSDMNFQ